MDRLKRYFMFYNSECFKESLRYETPKAVYQVKFKDKQQYLCADS